MPINGGCDEFLSGLCLDKVTAEFPKYPLKQGTKELKSICKDLGGEALWKRFPKMPSEVGDEIDILIGIQYNKYFSKVVHSFPTDLEVLRSVFVSPDGSDGIYGEPNPEFTKEFMLGHTYTFFPKLKAIGIGLSWSSQCHH